MLRYVAKKSTMDELFTNLEESTIRIEVRMQRKEYFPLCKGWAMMQRQKEIPLSKDTTLEYLVKLTLEMEREQLQRISDAILMPLWMGKLHQQTLTLPMVLIILTDTETESAKQG